MNKPQEFNRLSKAFSQHTIDMIANDLFEIALNGDGEDSLVAMEIIHELAYNNRTRRVNPR